MLKKLDSKIDVMPNRLEKYMAFMIILVFVESLEKVVKNLSKNDLKHLTQEFGSKNLEFLKQGDAYPYEYMKNFKRFCKKKLPDKKGFYKCLKDGRTGDNGKKIR